MHWYDEVEEYKRIDRWLGGFWGKGEGKRNGKWKWGIDCVRSVSVMLVLVMNVMVIMMLVMKI